jgi:hypothetical protein
MLTKLFQYLRGAKQSTPGASAIPLTELHAVLKFHRPTFDNEIGAITLRDAFPGFLPDPSQDPSAQADAMRHAGADRVFIVKEGPVRRRFAGDFTLSRGCYSSLCNDEHGKDEGTVARELSAYYEPAAAGDLAVRDLVMPQDAELLSKHCGAAPSGLAIELHSTVGMTNPILLKLRQAQLIPAGDTLPSVRIFIPLMVQKVEVGDVFDLRQLNTQQWLTRFLPKGDGVFSKPMAGQVGSFAEMLPSLIYPERGGG